ncbi:MAG: 23S rRNA (guanosine(2251)-2'-O)-methyltransferase RlmB [Eggerthellaceae bacterium]|nr:23S rRNA (guanosine(2251)-2'-O)-methyltransferase RlmB [Eggerthellaceae bacterium]MDR2715718.1 23S rRNA (guanosine(2251)-2'-O)-methyltransferase RlmB [Coriobacteriaceae bacterium]
MADYIEGKRPVIEALRTHVPISELLVADNLQRDGLVEDILRKARQTNTPVKTVPRRDLDKRSERGSHQGVMAQTKPFEYVSLQAILDAAQHRAQENGGAALVVLLDHITDAGNLGAIVRSAEAAGASGIVLPNKRAARVGAATYKSSAGAVAHVNISQVANIAQTIERLKKEGYWVAGASEQAQEVVWDANLKGRIALVLGSEGEGLARLTQESCDFLVKLPQVGRVASLNVAQAATACMYEWVRQNRPGQ